MASTTDTEIQAAAADIVPEENSITDNESSLVETGWILSRGGDSNSSGAVAPCAAAAPVSVSPAPLAQTCAVVTRRPARPSTSSRQSGAQGQDVCGRDTPSCPQNSRSVVTLRSPSIYRLAAAHISASLVSAAAVSVASGVAILDSGATHHLWPTYGAFINYHRVFNQHVTLADNSEVRIAGRGTIAIEMGGKKIVIRDVYHVPDLRLPLFSLRVHRRVPGCGYHSDNDGVCCFFPTFQLEVDDKVNTYVTCRSVVPVTKVFDYIQLRASANSTAAGSVPRRWSPRLNIPPAARPSAAVAPRRRSPCLVTQAPVAPFAAPPVAPRASPPAPAAPVAPPIIPSAKAPISTPPVRPKDRVSGSR